MELTPREVESRPRRRAPLTIVLVAGLVLALGFVVWQGLNNATRYFYSVDEAVERRDDLGDRRFRLQGTVVDGTVERDADRVVFEVTFHCVDAEVRHIGDPPELFKAGQAVVLEGHWAAAGYFESDAIFVKHSNEYRSADEYDARVAESRDADCSEAST